LAATVYLPPPAFCAFGPASSSSAVVSLAALGSTAELSATVTEAAKPGVARASMQKDATPSAFMVLLLVDRHFPDCRRTASSRRCRMGGARFCPAAK